MSKADEAKKTITIENVVASTAIGQEIDLKSVTLALEGGGSDNVTCIVADVVAQQAPAGVTA